MNSKICEATAELHFTGVQAVSEENNLLPWNGQSLENDQTKGCSSARFVKCTTKFIGSVGTCSMRAKQNFVVEFGNSGLERFQEGSHQSKLSWCDNPRGK